jgi:hypothetical protein
MKTVTSDRRPLFHDDEEEVFHDEEEEVFRDEEEEVEDPYDVPNVPDTSIETISPPPPHVRHIRDMLFKFLIQVLIVCTILAAIVVPIMSKKNTVSGGNEPVYVPNAEYDPDALYDVVVYGDSSSAVTASVSAKRQGLSIILVNPTHFLGGMSASGLGATDLNFGADILGGIASEFYAAIAAAYDQPFVRSFEPHVGQEVFSKLILDANVSVAFNERLDRESGVNMDGSRIVSITTLSGKQYKGKIFIDATYVGDLMAAAGVSYTVGREAEEMYGESLAGVRRGDIEPRNQYYSQGDKDHFIVNVDPYVTPGDEDTGLLPNVHKIDLVNGQGDDKIQAYNYRLCLTTDPKILVPITKPEGYREIDHELLLRNFEAGDHRLPALVENLAGNGSKVDWNSMHAVGTDYAGANYDYAEASFAQRLQIEKAHQTYIQGHLWTMAHSERVDETIRKRVAKYGLAGDEFADNAHWPYMIYIREARRMVSDYVITQHNCQGELDPLAQPVGLASFGMDSHAVQYFVNEEGHVLREGVIFLSLHHPYQIPYQSIIPKNGECNNLLVPVCLSSTHVALGSIRMEPVYMLLGESAANAAFVAIDSGVAVQEVNYTALRKRLELHGQKLNL